MAGPEPAWLEKKTNIIVGLESNWPNNKTNKGNYFPPTLLHAERYSFCIQEGTWPSKENNEGEEGLPGAEEAVPCWSDCFSSVAVVEAGGGVVAHGRWLQEVMLLFQAAEKKAPALPFSSVLHLFFYCVSFSFVLV